MEVVGAWISSFIEAFPAFLLLPYLQKVVCPIPNCLTLFASVVNHIDSVIVRSLTHRFRAVVSVHLAACLILAQMTGSVFTEFVPLHIWVVDI